jgi:nitrogen fixation protein FixH
MKHQDGFFHGWHLRKEITIGQIVVICCSLVAGVIAWQSLVNRVTLIESSQTRLESEYRRDIDAVRNETARDVQDIKQLLFRIEDKLDRKQDKQT